MSIRKEKIQKSCLRCSADFLVHPYRADSAKFCSRTCQVLSNAQSRVGTTYSEEHRKKISDGRKGKSLGFVPRSAFAKGHIPWSKDKKTGLTPWNKGIKYLAVTGEKNPNWKGGITSERGKMRGSAEYKVWRLSVFKRDWFSCQMPSCLYYGKDIQAHHIAPVRDAEEKIFETTNGITLCVGCHNLTRGKESFYQNLFTAIVATTLQETSLDLHSI